MSPRVSVLGSLNTDISVTVPRLPSAGETVLGRDAVIGSGGKGGNQAVAAARLGARVRMNGCRGDDEFGRRLGAELAGQGVDTAGVRVFDGAASGLALITVDASGENTISVAPGANALAGEEEVAMALAGGCDALVLSAEIPSATLASALAAARAAGVLCVLNLAPVPAEATSLVARADWLVVNLPEAGAVLGRAVAATDGVAAAEALARLGARHVAVTRGAAGAVLAGVAGTVAVPGFPVVSVDSVGAGDAFVGALAVALAAGESPAGAVRLACAAGAAATTGRGARAALPGPGEILAATGMIWPVSE